MIILTKQVITVTENSSRGFILGLALFRRRVRISILRERFFSRTVKSPASGFSYCNVPKCLNVLPIISRWPLHPDMKGATNRLQTTVSPA